MTSKTPAVKTSSSTSISTPKPLKKYQHYTSSRPAMRMTTTSGKKICFAGYSFITDNEDTISYLDSEIAQGLRDIVKGELKPMASLNPMKDLEDKIREQVRAEEKQKVLDELDGKERDFGNTESIGAGVKINAASTKTVAV